MSVTFTLNKGIAKVVINRPERMNAIDSKTEARLEAIWQKLEANASVRVVILSGAGDKAFCAGADLKAGHDGKGDSKGGGDKRGVDYWAHGNPNGFGGLSLRQDFNIPVIGRINGLALGGGLELALGCDILIASERAKFGLPEAKVGNLPLDGGMVLLPRRIPQNIAAGMMLSGRMMGAAEAHHYGLVNEVVSDDRLDEAVDAWVQDILSCAPLSCRAIKKTIRATAHLTPQEARNFSHPELITALTSEDAREGVAAFREKRTPKWKGK